MNVNLSRIIATKIVTFITCFSISFSFEFVFKSLSSIIYLILKTKFTIKVTFSNSDKKIRQIYRYRFIFIATIWMHYIKILNNIPEFLRYFLHYLIAHLCSGSPLLFISAK